MDVKFDETSYAPRTTQAARTSVMTSLVMKAGLAKDEKEANHVFLWIIGLCLLIPAGLWLVPALIPDPEVQPIVLPK
ncbi:MAG TPA: hypothetical protein VGE53_03585 [Candidatus Paceibacterota bacterium]